ncbi:MAG: AMP-binding protein [Candidatus Omnitrophota bacterium]
MDTQPTNIFLEFQKVASANSAKTCVKVKRNDAYESYSYEQIHARVLRLKHVLMKLGIQPGERVAIVLANGVHWPVAFFAVVAVQAVAVPVDIQLNPDSIKEILGHSQARIVLTEERFSVSFGDVVTGPETIPVLFMERQDWHAPHEEDEPLLERSRFADHKLAALFYTSGTTQQHKAVMLTHHNLLSNVSSVRKVGILTREDVIVSLLPLHHTYPFMVTCLSPLLEGATVCYLQTLAHHELFACIKDNRVTMFVGVPQLFTLMARSVSEHLKKNGFFLGLALNGLINVSRGLSVVSGRNLSKKLLKSLHETFGPHLKVMVSGGAKLDYDVARNFRRWGFNIIEGYGLTETSPVVTFNPIHGSRFDSVGKPLPGVKVRILKPGEDGLGEIAVRGENVMLGYYRQLSLTKKILQDGWFLTGDMGRLDSAGYLHVVGRKDELIVFSSGKKINPEEIEKHYLQSPFLKEICVLKVKSGTEGEHLAAVVVPDEDYLKAKNFMNMHFKIHWELDGFSQKLPSYQRVKGFVLTREALPRTRLGKLIRYKIQERFSRGGFRQEDKKEESGQPLLPFEAIALQYLSKILKKPVGIEDHLELDLGLDSLGRIELLSALQDLVNVGVDDSLTLELFQARTVRELLTKARQALPETAFGNLLEREDLLTWSQVVREPPAEENIKKLKWRFDAFDRFVALAEILLSKFLYRTLFSVRVKGKCHIPNDGPFVIVANHVSYLDAFYILCALPFSLLIKTYFVGFGSIFKHPLLAWAVRFHRLIPIDVDLNLAETLRMCRHILSQGHVLVYFPEGQRSADGSVKEFRKGIGILVKEANARVLPIYLEGAFRVWPRTRAFPLPGNVTVHIGPVVDTVQLSPGPAGDLYQDTADQLREKVQKLQGG